MYWDNAGGGTSDAVVLHGLRQGARIVVCGQIAMCTPARPGARDREHAGLRLPGSRRRPPPVNRRGADDSDQSYPLALTGAAADEAKTAPGVADESTPLPHPDGAAAQYEFVRPLCFAAVRRLRSCVGALVLGAGRYRAPRQFPINPPYAQYFAMKKQQVGTKKVVAQTLRS